MRVQPYFSTNPNDGEVYHESSDCLAGSQIALDNLRLGKGPGGQHQLCPICTHLLASGDGDAQPHTGGQANAHP